MEEESSESRQTAQPQLREPRRLSRTRLDGKLVATWACIVAIVALFGYAASVLGRTPCLGAADCFDYWRVMAPAGIEYLDSEPRDPAARFVRCKYQTRDAHFETGFSSTALLATLAKHLTLSSANQPGTMELRQMGLLCLAVLGFFIGGGLMLGFPPALALAITFVVVDPGYLLFFNSFYADSAMFLALVGSVVWLHLWGGRPRELSVLGSRDWAIAAVLLLLIAFLGGASKMQYVFLPALLLVTLALSVVASGSRLRARDAAPAVLLLALAVTIPWHFFRGSGPRFLDANNYAAVYTGIAAVSSDPDWALAELGIPEEYWDLPRVPLFFTEAWRADPEHWSEQPVQHYLSNLSRLRLLSVYLRDPTAARHILEAMQQEIAAVQTNSFGNYVEDEAYPAKTVYETWWQYSKLREKLLAWPPMVWVFAVAVGFWLLVSCRFGDGWQARKTAVLFLLLTFVTSAIATPLGIGRFDLGRHLVAGRLALDLLLVTTTWNVLTAFRTRAAHS